MKNVPCLDSDFPLWSWEKHINDETSDLYVQNAYEAITTGGYLYKFKTNVWNSMVLLLQRAYKEGNLTWDDKYGDIDSMEIYLAENDKILTAKRWNAIVHNISKEISTVWPWENEPTKRGYTGRRFMRTNDFLYGWYMEELYSEINRLIQICKGEADLAKLVTHSQSMTSVNANLTGAIAGMMGYAGNIKTLISAQLLGCPGGVITAHEKSSTLRRAILSKAMPGLMRSTCIEKTKTHANLYAAQAGNLLYQDSIKTNCHADLSAIPYVGKFSTNTIAKTLVYANLIGWRPLRITGKLISRDTVHAVLKTALPYLLGAESISESQTQAILQAVEPQHLIAHNQSGSSVKAELQYNNASLLMALTGIETLLHARLRACRSGPMYALIKSGSTHSAELSAAPAVIAEATVQSTSSVSADLIGAAAEQMAASIQSTSCESADLTLATPAHMESLKISQSKEFAELTYAKPVSVTSGTLESTIAHADLEEIPVRCMEGHEKSRSRINAQLVRRPARTVSALEQSGTLCYANLTLYKEGTGAWRDPEQRGNNLRIWNAHPQWQEGTSVHLDSGGVYYEPEQTGSNVYIRSTDSMKGDGIDG